MDRIVATLARRMAGRFLLLPLMLWVGARKWFGYLLGTKDAYRIEQLAHCWGYLHPRMEAHWQRLADPTSPDYGSWRHSLTNIGAEWARLDPQRAYKAGAFILVAALTVFVISTAAILVW